MTAAGGAWSVVGGGVCCWGALSVHCCQITRKKTYSMESQLTQMLKYLNKSLTLSCMNYDNHSQDFFLYLFLLLLGHEKQDLNFVLHIFYKEIFRCPHQWFCFLAQNNITTLYSW